MSNEIPKINENLKKLQDQEEMIENEGEKAVADSDSEETTETDETSPDSKVDNPVKPEHNVYTGDVEKAKAAAEKLEIAKDEESEDPYNRFGKKAA